MVYYYVPSLLNRIFNRIPKVRLDNPDRQTGQAKSRKYCMKHHFCPTGQVLNRIFNRIPKVRLGPDQEPLEGKMLRSFAAIVIFSILSAAAVAADISAIDAVNARRAAKGLPPFIEDPRLTLLAERVTAIRAAKRIHGHLRRGAGPRIWDNARSEGVGWNSAHDQSGRRFRSCFLYTRKRKIAGAGIVATKSGTYYTLVLR